MSSTGALGPSHVVRTAAEGAEGGKVAADDAKDDALHGSSTRRKAAAAHEAKKRNITELG